jgi:hypothetical protein
LPTSRCAARQGGGIAEGTDALGVKVLFQQAAENVVNCLAREALPG